MGYVMHIAKSNKKKAIDLMKRAVNVDYKNVEYKRILKELEDNDDEKDDEKEEQNDNIVKRVLKKYIFKTMDDDSNTVVCMDKDFNDVMFKLDQLKLDEINKINEIIDEGAKSKKDVKIVVIESYTKSNKVTQNVSHAII